MIIPNEDKTKLSILDTSQQLSGKTEISLLNIRGQMIVQKEFNADISNGSFTLDMPLTMSNGIYILKVNNSGISHSRKIGLHK